MSWVIPCPGERWPQASLFLSLIFLPGVGTLGKGQSVTAASTAQPLSPALPFRVHHLIFPSFHPKQHVQDGRKENLEGFVKTFEKELSGDAHPGVYALDCEMSYTTYGLELTCITVVDTDLQVVYDTFVRPDNEIVDYNTRFSGVTEADLADTSISLRDVQAVLLSMFSSDTVLIGHNLESDLLALKVIHSTVVDTSVLFPHCLGLPYKRSLRNLMADYLRQIIQDNGECWGTGTWEPWGIWGLQVPSSDTHLPAVDGHSSSEDASACMHLVIWKI